MSAKHVGVALLGLGVVGGGTYEILRDKRDMILKNDGVDIEVRRVLDRNSDRLKQLGAESLAARDIDEIVNDPDVDIVAEFFGGVEPARSFLIKALEAGKSIVTANKEMLAKSWRELEAAAERGGGGLYFEASCVGGVPVIRTLTDSMQGNAVTSLKGIVNGTTNYILSRMSDEGVEYGECLKEAQRLGYAEANPSADVDGFDSSYKNCILSSLAYRRRVPLDRIYREGISKINVKDIAYGKELGYTLKLLAISKCRDGRVEARVHPSFLPSAHPLAAVKGPFNALYIHGDSVDDIMLYGRGAGALPTGSAIVSDIVFAAGKDTHRRFAFELEDGGDTVLSDDFSSAHYIRFDVKNEEGTLAKISGAFAKCGVPVKTVLKKDDGTLIIVTHEAGESAVVRALAAAEQLSGVERVAAHIRVEE